MVELANILISDYRNKGLVIDTNLILLDFVGDYDVAQIQKFKRTITYTVDEYLILQDVIAMFNKVIFNKPILTEAFNLIDSLNNIQNYKLNEHLKKRIGSLVECDSDTNSIMGMNSFGKYGFADASIDLLSSQYLILTDDLRLYGYLSSKGKPALNFNHIRSALIK